MRGFEVPGVSVEGMTNEENIQALKGWGTNLAEQLTYELLQMRTELDQLREMSGLKEENDGEETV
jgi:hypothetical protein